MNIDVSKRAVTFSRSDEPVARTVANGEGVLLDLDDQGRVLALEIHERHATGLAALVAEYPDLEGFLDEAAELVDEIERQRRTLRWSRSRRLHELVRTFPRHVPA